MVFFLEKIGTWSPQRLINFMDQNLETIDVLMATYNGEKYIDAQIQSLLNQTHQNFCLYICDDHSKDNTKAIIEKYAAKYPEKIKIIVSEKNLGAIQNFSFLLNHSTNHSTADYVMFADQDDIWINDKIEKSLAKMKHLEKVHGKGLPLLVHTDLTVVDQNLKVLGNSFWKYTNLKPFSFHTTNRFLVQNVVTGCTMMLNRQLCQLSLPVPSEAIMHDWWIALTAATFGKIGIVNEPTILYRQHGSNTLGAKKFKLFSTLKDRFIAYCKKDRTLQNKMNARQTQAKAFFERFQTQLKCNDQLMFNDYLNFQNHSFLKKRIIVVKHGFYRSEWVINCALFVMGVKP